MSGFTPWPDQELDNPRLADVSDGARLLYMAILARVSHRGRLPGTPRGLARELRLNHASTVSRYLNELVAVRVVELVDGTLDGAPMRILSVVGYADIESLPDNRRYSSKLPSHERFPLDQDAESQHQSGSQSAESTKEDESDGEESEKTEEKKSTRTSAGAGARKKAKSDRRAPDEQLHLASPIESPIECPEPIRTTVEAWEEHAQQLRRRGVEVPQVARRDILALAAGVAPEVFVEAVRLHLKAKPSFWLSPLVCLSLRIKWGAANLIYVEPPEVAVSWAPSAADEPIQATECAASDVPIKAFAVAFDDQEWFCDWQREWQRALHELQGTVDPWDWVTYLASLQALGSTTEGQPVPVLACADSADVAWVREHYLDKITRVLGFEPTLGLYEMRWIADRTAGRPGEDREA